MEKWSRVVGGKFVGGKAQQIKFRRPNAEPRDRQIGLLPAIYCVIGQQIDCPGQEFTPGQPEQIPLWCTN